MREWLAISASERQRNPSDEKAGLAYSYHPNHKHAVSSYNGTSYGYDANGCMTSRGSQTIRYDPESRPVRVDAGGMAVCRFAYDGDGVRRKRLDSAGTIHYLGGYERKVGNGAEVVTKYYHASFGAMRRLVALRRSGILYYVGTDHLGSTIRVADSSFTPVDGMRYTPYGTSRDPGTNLNSDRKFTSQIEDASIGLYWYASRAYDPAIGRFTQPDSIVPDGTNPQALNRYSYVYNNPVRLTDPSGHDPLGPEWEARWRAEHPDRADGPTDDERRSALLRLLATLREEDDTSVSGTELFARKFERLALLYGRDEATQFVRAVGFLFAGIHYDGNPWINLTRGSFLGDRRGDWQNLPVSGLRQGLLDSEFPKDNQTHHYSAFFMAGYFLGYAPGSGINSLRDATWTRYYEGKPENWGDVRLGDIAARHGSQLLVDAHRGRPLDPSRIGGWIRKYLVDANAS